jgi:hypothetical protein
MTAAALLLLLLPPDPCQPELLASAADLDYKVLPAKESSPDRASLINQAWAHFTNSPQHQVLIVLQDDVQVHHGVFDTMAACFQQLPHTAILGPLINAMNVGEKATDMDEKLLCWQNSHHRRTRKYFSGRMPKDCNARLPCTPPSDAPLSCRTPHNHHNHRNHSHHYHHHHCHQPHSNAAPSAVRPPLTHTTHPPPHQTCTLHGFRCLDTCVPLLRLRLRCTVCVLLPARHPEGAQ